MTLRSKLSEVRKITDQKVRDDNNKYLVHWKDGSPSQWVDERKCDCPLSIFEFEKRVGVRMLRFCELHHLINL